MATSGSAAAPASPNANTAAPIAAAPKKRQLSCLGKALISFVDGGMFGAAIGSIVASAQAVTSVASGADSIPSAARGVFRAGWQGGLRLGAALAGYSGGVCSLEKMRGRRDAANPFLIGGVMGALGTVQRVDYHDGQTQHRRVLSVNPRAMMGASLSSALLCTMFWYLQTPSRHAREQRVEDQLQPEKMPPQVPTTIPEAPVDEQLRAAAPAVDSSGAIYTTPFETPSTPRSELLDPLTPSSETLTAPTPVIEPGASADYQLQDPWAAK